MVSKDQTIGGIIFFVCLVIAILYIIVLFGADWLVSLKIGITDAAAVRLWAIAIPVFLAFILVLGIGAWIGWTMATTPPPKSIEEIEAEAEKEEKEAEKKEE
jgi:predicted DNA-binding transcriptional regulator